jgi:prepilin signal peptidase PulO-like enzyme (type II secretory pathway)
MLTKILIFNFVFNSFLALGMLLISLAVGHYLSLIIDYLIKKLEVELNDDPKEYLYSEITDLTDKKTFINNFPFIEIVTVISFLLEFYHQTTFPIFNLSEFIFNLIFISTNILLIFVNLQTLLIPNVVTLYGTAIFLIGRFFIPIIPSENKFQWTFLVTLLSISIVITVFTLSVVLLLEKVTWKIALMTILFIFFSICLNWFIENPESFFELERGFLYFWKEKISPYPGINSLFNSILAMVIGSGLLIVIACIYYILKGVEAIGGGIIKMMLLLGAFLGWGLALSTLLMATLALVVSAAGIYLLKGKNILWRVQIPFGVYLGVCAIISMIYGR